MIDYSKTIRHLEELRENILRKHLPQHVREKIDGITETIRMLQENLYPAEEEEPPAEERGDSVTQHNLTIGLMVKLIREKQKPCSIEELVVYAADEEVKLPARSTIAMFLSTEIHSVHDSRIKRVSRGVYDIADNKELLQAEAPRKKNRKMRKPSGSRSKYMTQKEQVAYAKEFGLTEEDVRNSVDSRRIGGSGPASAGKAE